MKFDILGIECYLDFMGTFGIETLVFTDDYQFGKTNNGILYLDKWDKRNQRFNKFIEAESTEEFIEKFKNRRK